MTMLNTDIRNVLTAAGGTSFTYTFKIYDEAHIRVLVADSDGQNPVVQTLGVDYTVTGVENPSGGSIIFSVAPTAAKKVILTLNTPLTQTTDLVTADLLPAETLEESLDLIVSEIGTLKARVDRAPLLPESTIRTTELVLPDYNVTTNQGKFLKLTSSGLDLATVSTDSIANPLTTKGDLLGRDSSTPIRVPVGTNTQVLTANSANASGLGWVNPVQNTMTTKGDLLVATASATAARRGVGSEGDILICLPATSDGLAWQVGLMNGAPLLGGHLVVTSSAGASTIVVKTTSGADPSSTTPVFAVFRNSNGLLADVTLRKITSALSLTIPSGATLGTDSGNHHRIHIGLIDNAGTVELLCWNGHTVSGLGGIWYAESQVLSTTTMSTGSDSPHTMYSVTGRTTKGWRYAGYAEYQVATAGTWPSPYQVATATILTPLPGTIMQARVSATGVLSTSATTAIPYDDTIPQITEGTELLSIGVQALNQANIMQISAQMYLSINSASTAFAMALFKDSTANAVSAAFALMNAAQPVPLNIHYQEKANSIAVVTYRVRVGADGGATTCYMNGTSAGRKYGGVANSYIRVDEIWS